MMMSVEAVAPTPPRGGAGGSPVHADAREAFSFRALLVSWQNYFHPNPTAAERVDLATSASKEDDDDTTRLLDKPIPVSPSSRKATVSPMTVDLAFASGVAHPLTMAHPRGGSRSKPVSSPEGVS